MEKLNIVTGRKLKYCFDLAVFDIFGDPKIFETIKDYKGFDLSHMSSILYVLTKPRRSKKVFDKIVQDNPSNSPKEFIVAWKKSITKDLLMDLLMEGSTESDIKVFTKNKKQLDVLLDRLLKKISTLTIEESNEAQKAKSLRELVGKGLHDKIKWELTDKDCLLDSKIIKEKVDKTSYTEPTKKFIFEECKLIIKSTLQLLANTSSTLDHLGSYRYRNYQPLLFALNKAFEKAIKKMDLSKKKTWRENRGYLKDIFTDLTEVIKDYIYPALDKSIKNHIEFRTSYYDGVKDEIFKVINQISKETLTILKNSVLNPKEFENGINRHNIPFFIKKDVVKTKKKQNQFSK